MDRRGPPGRLLTIVVMGPIAVAFFGFIGLIVFEIIGLLLGFR